MRYILFVALLLAGIPLSAQVNVGDDAPDIKPEYWINPPTWSSLSELRGDVVMIKAWGKN
jgi:hypothetical protein